MTLPQIQVVSAILLNLSLVNICQSLSTVQCYISFGVYLNRLNLD